MDIRERAERAERPGERPSQPARGPVIYACTPAAGKRGPRARLATAHGRQSERSMCGLELCGCDMVAARADRARTGEAADVRASSSWFGFGVFLLACVCFGCVCVRCVRSSPAVTAVGLRDAGGPRVGRDAIRSVTVSSWLILSLACHHSCMLSFLYNQHINIIFARFHNQVNTHNYLII